MVNQIPDNWREFVTVDERDLTNRWSMWGSDCLTKVGRLWDSQVPGAPLFRTKREAGDFLSTFVCDAIPQRCIERAETGAGLRNRTAVAEPVEQDRLSICPRRRR